MQSLNFHDANSGIHGYTINGEIVTVTHQVRQTAPVSTITYSREAAILMSLSILRRFAPWRLTDPDRAAPAVVLQFPVQRLLADVLGDGR